MVRKKRSFYYGFVENSVKVLRHERVREFPHRNDPRKYGVRVNICFLVLRAFEGKSYRRIVRLVEEMPEILQLLGVDEVPHWTTLHKAAGNIPVGLIERLVACFVSMTRSKSVRGGIDATGFQLTSASSYYVAIVQKRSKKKKKRGRPKKRRKVSKFLKLSTVVDLNHQLPMAFKLRRGPASDLLDAINLVRKAHQNVKPLKSLDADKGYTSEDPRKTVVEECGAEDRIKFKNPDIPIHRTKGVYLKKAKRQKLRRNGSALCETFHSVIKRITGSTVRAVKVGMQNREAAFKILAYSTLKKTITSLIKRTFLLSRRDY